MSESDDKRKKDEKSKASPDDPTVFRAADAGKTRQLNIDELSELTDRHSGRPTRSEHYVEQSTGTGSEVSQPADRFTLTEVLGEGSQGEVCRAFDNHLQRDIAIKFPHRGGDDAVAREILDEARKSARLNHPNIVTIYECGHWKGRPYISMEFVDGPSLASVLKDSERISVERFSGYADQILRALQAAHDSGLFHRDLKPHNVLVAADGMLKLTDFGIAHQRKSTSSRDRTMRVEVAGTPAYMAPEQWLGERPDARTDIYAFGCMGYKLLCGRPPFPREESAKHHLQSAPPPLRRFAPHVPEEIEAIIMRCLEKDPDLRFQTCEELRVRLLNVDTDPVGTGATVLSAKPAKKSKSRVAVFLVLMLLVFGGATGFLALTEPGREIWDRAAAKLGLAPVDEVDEVDPDAGDVEPPPITETDTRIDEARTLFARARDAASPDEAIQLAERARGLADSDPAFVNEIAAFLRTAREKRQASTEDEIVSAFEKDLASIREKRDAGDLEAAWADVEALEKRAIAERALRNREVDVRREKLPLAARLGSAYAADAKFDAAAERFETASRIADSLGDGTKRDGYRRSAELTRTLHRLAVVAADQPRYVLVELAALGEEPPFLSAEFVRARAWYELGFDGAARGALESCLAGSPGPDLTAKARSFLDALPAR